MRAEGAGNKEIAGTFVEVAQRYLPTMYSMFETVHRRHIVEAVRRYALWGAEPSTTSTTTAVVGFADVVGSTQIGNDLPQDEVDEMLRTFEIRALALTTGPASRLVKMIGDEVLFVARDAAEAARIVRELLRDPALPELRAGLAGGEVVTRDGDVYGPVVNLAARLVASAEPGVARVDASVAAALGAEATENLGTATFKGFDEPVVVYQLR
jgi:adenylate cyclase